MLDKNYLYEQTSIIIPDGIFLRNELIGMNKLRNVK